MGILSRLFRKPEPTIEVSDELAKVLGKFKESPVKAQPQKPKPSRPRKVVTEIERVERFDLELLR